MTENEFRRQVRAQVRQLKVTTDASVRAWLRGEYQAVLVRPHIRHWPRGSAIPMRQRAALLAVLPTLTPQRKRA